MTERLDAIYARQSIDKADSISIESQIEQCKYETKGAAFQVFADRGYSGKNMDRPQFQALLSAVRSGKIRRVICYKLDRCSRSILDFTRLMEEFQTYGVEFVSCTEKFDTGTPMGRAMLSICVVFAQLERETIQQRIRDAYSSRSKRGFYMGGRVPFGFRLEEYELEGKRTARYVPEPKEAEILQFMYREYKKPETSLGDVVQALQNAGIANPRRMDGIWVRSHLGRVLHNPIYVRADWEVYRYFLWESAQIINDPMDFIGENGCYLYKNQGKPQLVLAPHTGLIDSETWLRCMAKRRGKESSTQKKTPSSWLTGKVKCLRCGYAIAVRQRKRENKVYRYFVCSRSLGTEKQCSGVGCIPAELLEGTVFKELSSYLQKISLPRQPDSHAAQLQTQCLGLENKIRELVEASISTSTITKAYLDEKIQEYHNLLTKSQEALADETRQETIPADKMLQHWDQHAVWEKKRILDAFVERIQVSNHTLRILWRF